MSTLHILFVNHTSDFSGAEIALLRLINALPDDVRCAVAAPARGPFADALASEGVEHVPIPGTDLSFRLGLRTTPRSLTDLVRSAATLRLHIRRRRPDVVHANGLRAGLLCARARRGQAPALIVQVHDLLPASALGRAVRRVVAHSADRVLCVSEAATHAFNDGLPSRPATTQYIGIDHTRFRPDGPHNEIRHTFGIPADAPLLGQVGQITPWKNQLTSLDAMPDILRRHPAAHLVLVGTTAFTGAGVRYDNVAYERELHRRVEELGLEAHVHFTGQQRDVPGIMRELDLLLLPSWEEPFGTVMVEAMACAVPALVTDRGGPPEVVEDGVTGRALPPRDPDAWARAVVDLLDDPERRREMGARAAQAARRFDDHAYADGCLAAYRAVAASAPPPRPQGLRVLAVNHTSTVSGGERSLLDLLDGLGDGSVAVVTACPDGDLAERLGRAGHARMSLPGTDLGFRVHPVWTVTAVVGLVRSAARVRGAVVRGRFDLVHANSLRAGLVALGALGRAPRIVFVRDRVPSTPAGRLATWASGRGDVRFVANSRFTAASFAAVAGGARPITVAPSPVDGARLDPDRVDVAAARRRLGIERDAFIAGVVGQITPWKGHDVAIEAVAAARRQGADVVLVIVGDVRFAGRTTRFDNVAYLASLHELTHRLGVEDAVHFVGEREDVDVVMAGLDLLLVPSHEEPFGRVVAEALAMGRRVIATDRGGPAEILSDDDDGVLLPPDQVAAWGEALLSEVARSETDEARRRRRQRVLARFERGRHVEQIAGLWRTAAGVHAPSESPG